MMGFKFFFTHHQLLFKKAGQKLLLIVCLGFVTSLAFANNDAPKPMYYRYYDGNGVPNVSRNVTPTHIRRGYDVLDRNMYLIKKVPAYNVEADLRQESVRAAQSERTRKDQQIKRSYRNVAHATEKKKEALNVIQKQLTQQYQQMKQLQTDRSAFLQQKASYVLDRKDIPSQLQKNLDNNDAHIKNTRQNIEKLKNTYASQEQYFDYIIGRLQTLE